MPTRNCSNNITRETAEECISTMKEIEENEPRGFFLDETWISCKEILQDYFGDYWHEWAVNNGYEEPDLEEMM